jgi:hypothetical protein
MSMSEKSSNHANGSDDEPKQERKRVRDKTIRGKRLMDLIIYFLIGLAAICGGFLGVLSYLGYWQNKESWAVWSLYGVIFFTITAGFVTWQKRIWDAQDAAARAQTENRGWITFERITGAENLKVGQQYSLHAIVGYRGTVPATIIRSRIAVRLLSTRLSYTTPLRPEDIDERYVLKLPGPSPIVSIGNEQTFVLPVFGGPFNEEMRRDLANGILQWHILGSVEYESGGAMRYTTFCALFDPDLGNFGICGGTMT